MHQKQYSARIILAFVFRPSLGPCDPKTRKWSPKAQCLVHDSMLRTSDVGRLSHCVPDTFIESNILSNVTSKRARLLPFAAVLDKTSSSKSAALVASFVVVKEPKKIMFDNIKIVPPSLPARAGSNEGRRGFNLPEHFDVAKYRLETVLTWDITAQTFMLWSLFATVVLAGAYSYQRTTGLRYGKAFWLSWCALSGAEPDFSARYTLYFADGRKMLTGKDLDRFRTDDPLPAKVVVGVLTIFQFLFFALLIGAIESSLSEKISELKSGRTKFKQGTNASHVQASHRLCYTKADTDIRHILLTEPLEKVYEANHDVILGWNSRLPRVLRQIAIAGKSNRERVRVVVLANEWKEMMDTRIQELINRGEFRNVVITCRSGDPMSAQDQQLVAIDRAKTVLILSGNDDSFSPSMSDSLALSTALALKHGGSRIPRPSIIIESKVAANRKLFSKVGGNVKDLGWPELASRQLVKSIVQPAGLIATYRQLLDFEGSELFIHFGIPMLSECDVANVVVLLHCNDDQREMGVEGRTVREARRLLDECVLVGIVRKDGARLLNPRPADIIYSGDRVILLGARKTPLAPCRTNVFEKAQQKADVNTARHSDVFRDIPVERPRMRILVLGWRPGMSSILHEIDGTVGHGSEVTIVSNVEAADRRSQLRQERFTRLHHARVRHRIGDPCAQTQIKRSGLGRIEAVLVLMDHYTPGMSSKHREAKVLESLLSLQLVLEEAKLPSPKVVAEVMGRDSERLVRAENTKAECLSLDEFSALLLAQAAYEPDILPILQELLACEGPELSLRPASLFFTSSDGYVTFEEISKRGWDIGETVLGYISEPDGQVRLHPSRNRLIRSSAVRHVVTITDDIHSLLAIGASR